MLTWSRALLEVLLSLLFALMGARACVSRVCVIAPQVAQALPRKRYVSLGMSLHRYLITSGDITATVRAADSSRSR